MNQQVQTSKSMDLNKQKYCLKYRKRSIDIPSKPGYVYGYLHTREEANWIKIGYTNNVARRTAQWHKDDGYIPEMQFTIYSKHAELLQHYVHDYFWQYREPRLIMNPTTGRQNFRIEWFKFESLPLEYVQTAVALFALYPREGVSPITSVHKQMKVLFPSAQFKFPQRYRGLERNLHFSIEANVEKIEGSTQTEDFKEEEKKQKHNECQEKGQEKEQEKKKEKGRDKKDENKQLEDIENMIERLNIKQDITE